MNILNAILLFLLLLVLIGILPYILSVLMTNNKAATRIKGAGLAFINRMKNLPSRMKSWSRSRKQKRLDRLREALRGRIEKLATLEGVIVRLYMGAELDDVIGFMNEQEMGSWRRVRERLFLDDGGPLWHWLRISIERDIVNDRWTLQHDRKVKGLSGPLKRQRIAWLRDRKSWREECMRYQASIEELEESLGITKPDTEPRAPDKRTRLKGLRVRVTEMRLEEERLEQEILDEENRGASGPHRRKAGISTDTD